MTLTKSGARNSPGHAGRGTLAIDLCCGLGGWTDGLLAEGYDVIGFDIEQHVYGEHRYPGQLVLQDILTLHGSQFRTADLIVASPPCQKYSYMAMPWKRSKALAAWYREDESRQVELNALFTACFRIQREACEAAGRHIPLIVENVRGAQPWVGRARWSFGSFYLWGDVPALMPHTFKLPKQDRKLYRDGHNVILPQVVHRDPEGRKNNGGSWFAIGSPGQKVVGNNPDGRLLHVRDGHSHTRHLTNPAEHEGVKNGNDWFGAGEDCSAQRRAGSKSPARKAASAMIAKIPLALSRHIARMFKPQSELREAA